MTSILKGSRWIALQSSCVPVAVLVRWFFYYLLLTSRQITSGDIRVYTTHNTINQSLWRRFAFSRSVFSARWAKKCLDVQSNIRLWVLLALLWTQFKILWQCIICFVRELFDPGRSGDDWGQRTAWIPTEQRCPTGEMFYFFVDQAQTKHKAMTEWRDESRRMPSFTTILLPEHCRRGSAIWSLTIADGL